MAITKETILETLAPICGGVQSDEFRGDLTVMVERADLLEALRELRDNPRTQFNQLLDITAIDWYKKKPRYEVVYFLYSLVNNTRLRVKTPVEGKHPSCPSATQIWESADWYERETFDMYGISFDGHHDLRRFYMPEDFMDPESGEPLYPLRKDFPVMGVAGALPLPEKNPVE